MFSWTYLKPWLIRSSARSTGFAMRLPIWPAMTTILAVRFLPRRLFGSSVWRIAAFFTLSKIGAITALRTFLTDDRADELAPSHDAAYIFASAGPPRLKLSSTSRMRSSPESLLKAMVSLSPVRPSASRFPAPAVFFMATPTSAMTGARRFQVSISAPALPVRMRPICAPDVMKSPPVSVGVNSARFCVIVMMRFMSPVTERAPGSMFWNIFETSSSSPGDESAMSFSSRIAWAATFRFAPI